MGKCRAPLETNVNCVGGFAFDWLKLGHTPQSALDKHATKYNCIQFWGERLIFLLQQFKGIKSIYTLTSSRVIALQYNFKAAVSCRRVFYGIITTFKYI